ncbi:MAG: hypothetical protein BWY28_02229 [bacterium ADurb.Bin236]|nr:MAG: hypothetical protein BWY28_02229 [bacterium ADurb.Bin236]
MWRDDAHIPFDDTDAGFNLVENLIELIPREIRVLHIDVFILVPMAASRPFTGIVLISGVGSGENHSLVSDVRENTPGFKSDADVIVVRFGCRKRRDEDFAERPIRLPHLDRRFHVGGKPVIPDCRVVGVRQELLDCVKEPDAVPNRERHRRVRLRGRLDVFGQSDSESGDPDSARVNGRVGRYPGEFEPVVRRSVSEEITHGPSQTRFADLHGEIQIGVHHGHAFLPLRLRPVFCFVELIAGDSHQHTSLSESVSATAARTASISTFAPGHDLK